MSRAKAVSQVVAAVEPVVRIARAVKHKRVRFVAVMGQAVSAVKIKQTLEFSNRLLAWEASQSHCLPDRFHQP